MKRKITKRDEKIYRLVHHDHCGLTQIRAAERMGCSVATISRALSRMRKEFPMLFPILTKREADVYELADELGFTNEQIAILLKITLTAVGSTIRRIRNKGLIISRRKHVILQLEPDMDNHVVKKF